MAWLTRISATGNVAYWIIAAIGVVISSLPVLIWSGLTLSVGQQAMIVGAGLAGGISAFLIAQRKNRGQATGGFFALRWISFIVIGCVTLALLAFLVLAFAASYGSGQGLRIAVEAMGTAVPLTVYLIKDYWPVLGLFAASIVVMAVQISRGRTTHE